MSKLPPALERGLISLVIPATSEGSLLARTVRSLLGRFALPLELVVVVNGGRRLTVDLARAAARTDPRVTALIYPHPLGKGGAILAGLKRARGEVLGFLDADGPVIPGDLERMARHLLDGRADAVIASKWLGKRYREVDTYTLRSKKLLGRGLNLITRRGFGLPHADTQGGAKLLTRAAWRALDAGFICRGFDFDVELLWRLDRAGFAVEEWWVECRQNRASTFRGWEVARMLLNLARLRFR